MEILSNDIGGGGGGGYGKHWYTGYIYGIFATCL